MPNRSLEDELRDGAARIKNATPTWVLPPEARKRHSRRVRPGLLGATLIFLLASAAIWANHLVNDTDKVAIVAAALGDDPSVQGADTPVPTPIGTNAQNNEDPTTDGSTLQIPGTEWALVDSGTGSQLGTITFYSDGYYAYVDTCTGATGRYTTRDDFVHFESSISPMIGCPPSEGRVTMGTRYEIVEGSLVAGDGVRLALGSSSIGQAPRGIAAQFETMDEVLSSQLPTPQEPTSSPD